MFGVLCVFLCFGGCLAQQNLSYPVPVLAITASSMNGSSCASPAVRAALRQDLLNQVEPRLRCPCHSPGKWTRIAYLNMNDPSQQCPPNWNLTDTPVRGCSRLYTLNGSCDSTFFPSGGRFYSRVCGRLNAYQKGNPNGVYDTNIDDTYVDGVSLTHGPEGSRQHIWTFAVAASEGCDFYGGCPAPTPASRRLMKYLHQITISVTPVTLDQGVAVELFIPIIFCGMDQGAVLLMSAVNSTTLPGSARHYHNPPQMT